MRSHRFSIAVACVVLVLAGVGPTLAADEPSGADAISLCRQTAGNVPEIGPRACRSLEQGSWGAGTACRKTVDESCDTADGRHISPALLAEYRASWVHRALTLQRALGDDQPLSQGLWLHTHNSFNSATYSTTLSGLDPNQRYSLGDQLDMDIRAIEIDIHWAPSPEGDPAQGMKAPVMCHAEPAGSGEATVHAGCTYERTLSHGLTEVREWLESPGNTDEIVMLYLENNLDGLPAAHDVASKAIETELGSLVYRPAGSCDSLPLAATPAEIRATGARILLVGNCGPGSWGTWVHERNIPTGWNEASSGAGDDYPADCGPERARYQYGSRLIRRYEDSTWLSAMAGTGGQVTTVETGRMVACGVNLVGFDQLGPDDPRLAAAVWSWAPGEPTLGSPSCAALNGAGRMISRDCGESHRVACFDGSSWVLTSEPVAWSAAEVACGTSRFGVPWNGWESNRLRTAAGGKTVWLSYRRTAQGWLPVG